MNLDEYRQRLRDATTDEQTLTSKTSYFAKNGLLWKNTPNGPRRVIRQNERMSILLEAHAGLTSAHFRIGATTKKIKQRYWWPNMDHEIRDFVESCEACQRKDSPRKTQELHPIPVSGPFKRVGIDIFGPVPASKNGNRYMIVATDYLTKWPEARATSNISSYHGCTVYLRRDNLSPWMPRNDTNRRRLIFQ
jgi:hypothetical protein